MSFDFWVVRTSARGRELTDDMADWRSRAAEGERPISIEEWRAVVEHDPELKWLGFPEIVNEFETAASRD